MTKTLIATTLAAAMALTSMTTTPARAADTGELGRILLGAGALIIIGSAISNNNNGRVERHNTNPVYVAPERPRYSKVLPSNCLRHNQWRNGPRKFVGRHCLNRHNYNVSRLPRACVRGFNTAHGYLKVFGARCLRKHGWRFG